MHCTTVRLSSSLTLNTRASPGKAYYACQYLKNRIENFSILMVLETDLLRLLLTAYTYIPKRLAYLFVNGRPTAILRHKLIIWQENLKSHFKTFSSNLVKCRFLRKVFMLHKLSEILTENSAKD